MCTRCRIGHVRRAKIHLTSPTGKDIREIEENDRLPDQWWFHGFPSWCERLDDLLPDHRESSDDEESRGAADEERVVEGDGT